jgi:FMN-dependent NADH-azoreductase
MNKFLKDLFDKVFSVPMVLFLFAASFLCFIFSIAEQDRTHRAETQQVTEACYAQGMVVVNTDAGKRCADPRSLVKVK